MKIPDMTHRPRRRITKAVLLPELANIMMPRQSTRLMQSDTITAVTKFLYNLLFVFVYMAAMKSMPVEIASAAMAVSTEPGVRSAARDATKTDSPRVHRKSKM